ncbi:putative CocE/NonD family hydrolase [Nitrobacteraceae bacterium AZCC 2299]
MKQGTQEVRDGMRITWDAPIVMDDGNVLRADIFLPLAEGRYPVIMTHGPYAKWLSFQEGYPNAWNNLIAEHPDVAAGSSNKYQSWEVVDPEKWVPDGYAIVRVDSRGAGRSPGLADFFSPNETKDFYTCIEWAGSQDWSDGKVGLNGISYYAINQWQVAALQPPHLKAMCVWEGAADFYRDGARHGGILTTFFENWAEMQCINVQNGVGERGPRSVVHGGLVCGPETLTPEQLEKNRVPIGKDVADRFLDDEYYQGRSPDWSKVVTPLLSAASWAGQGLHPRGNFEGFSRAASTQKWLEVHGLEHWTHFMTDYGVGLQKRFFAHFLKGDNNGWDKEPRVQLNVRHVGERFIPRAENEWPLARTQWTKLYLDATDMSLRADAPHTPAKVDYEALGEGMTFALPVQKDDVELCGPIAAKLFIATSTTDADFFVVVRIFDPEGKEVVFKGTTDPPYPVRARLAAGVAPQARSRSDVALSAVSRAR